jgi:hypothetical protein
VRDHGSDSLRKGLQTLDTYWLADKPFMAGDTMSAADLLVACQIEMLRWGWGGRVQARGGGGQAGDCCISFAGAATQPVPQMGCVCTVAQAMSGAVQPNATGGC